MKMENISLVLTSQSLGALSAFTRRHMRDSSVSNVRTREDDGKIKRISEQHPTLLNY